MTNSSVVFHSIDALISPVDGRGFLEEDNAAFFDARLICRIDGKIARALMIAITKYADLMLAMKSICSDDVTEMGPIRVIILVIKE